MPGNKLKDFLADTIVYTGLGIVFVTMIPIVIVATPYLIWRWAEEQCEARAQQEKIMRKRQASEEL